ncbi:hypothetical protein ACG33_14830 [Steroidobacter denitrificans]|uniref:Ubiquinone biosynthesis accessory factor UbiJ n=1 Tax=Steroidobacter denitrificans TaxID=465721 RepID=A0A127FD84_STEDE|nr:SCP2 sterol-binding domain-containing protein [Steroidobacter denitrificans]AMN48347.1 hypothetical protein ACG33_14830 [Steroidobacter denitrificans]
MRLALLESLLNRHIAASSEARSLCRRLGTKTLALHIQGLPLSLYFLVDGQRLQLTTDHGGSTDASLSGSPLSFLRLMGQAPEGAVRTGSIQINGDAEVAQTFSELLRQARPDLEEELARYIGDVAAHQIGNAARSTLDFVQRSGRTLAQNVTEFLQEEGRDAPNRTEADELMTGVDRLRDDVDRLAARLDQLERQRLR